MKLLLAYLALQAAIVVFLAVTMPAAMLAGVALLAFVFGGFFVLARALGYGWQKTKDIDQQQTTTGEAHDCHKR